MIERFYKPKTLSEALKIKAEFNKQAQFLAGGTGLNSKDCHLQAKSYIDLKGLISDEIKRDKDHTTIGALCTIQNLIEDNHTPPFLKIAAKQVINRNVRHMGTIGGQIVMKKTYCDLVPMLFALEAKVEIMTAEKTEQVSMKEYIEVRKRELITNIIIPHTDQNRLAACRHFKNSSNELALLNAAVSYHFKDNTLSSPVIAISGVSKNILRLSEIENKLNNSPLPDTDTIIKLISDHVEPDSDIKGSAAFKKHQAGVMVALCLKEARHEN